MINEQTQKYSGLFARNVIFCATRTRLLTSSFLPLDGGSDVRIQDYNGKRNVQQALLKFEYVCFESFGLRLHYAYF